MSDRVKLPKEVAEAIEILLEEKFDTAAIFREMMFPEPAYEELKIVYDFAYQSNETFKILLSAFLNGYEVEQTPEDNLRQRYTDLMEQSQHPDIPSTEKIALYNYTAGIKFALTSLSIEIEGITK